MTPEEYLLSLGIEPAKYILVAYIDGVMRSPSLIEILKGYSKIKDIPFEEEEKAKVAYTVAGEVYTINPTSTTF